MLRSVAAFVSALLAAAFALAADEDPRPFDPERDAAAQVDAALERAADAGRHVLLVFGANWCHDSRGLAGKIARAPELGAVIEAAYELEYVDVGQRDRNLDQLARFGVEHIFGTPTVVIVDPHDGSAVNAPTFHDWRMADDAGVADLAAYFGRAAGVEVPIGGARWADVDKLAAEWRGYQDARAAIAAYANERRAALDPEDPEAVAVLDAEIARREAFALGYARSYARFAMGRVGRRDEQAIIAADALDATPAETDATLEVAAYMASRDTMVPADFGGEG
jgi:hypothetical protein